MRNNQKLKFKIKKVGRISSATIEPSRLTIFLGRNDSGKTYAAASIWAVLNSIKRYRSKDKSVLKIISELASSAAACEDGFSEAIPVDLLVKIQKALQKHLSSNLSRDLADTIGYDGFSESSLQLEMAHDSDVSVCVRIIKDKSGFSHGNEAMIRIIKGMGAIFSEVEISLLKGEKTIYRSSSLIPTSRVQEAVKDRLNSVIVGYSCLGDDFAAFNNAIYIPAARTGIMIALDYFIGGVLKRAELSSNEALEQSQNLPAPIRDFAIRLSMPGRVGGKGGSSILQKILRGKLERGDRRGEFLYTPENSEAVIPLASTSSLVTELAAFPAVVERQFKDGAFLIFEEPEAHLHLEAQRDMARVIANIVNSKNAKVLITSHSDTFIQQVNNLIAISDHPERNVLQEDFGFSDNDLIDRSSVRAYDFVCVDGVTNPAEIELTKTGFVAKSLNDVLIKLLDETMRINDGLAE